MTIYRAYIHLASDECGNGVMQMVANIYAEQHADKRPLIVTVHEHAGWFLSYLYGAPGISDGTICGTANDDAVLPRGVIKFGKKIEASKGFGNNPSPVSSSPSLGIVAVLFIRKEQAMKKKDRERFVKQATQLLLSLGAKEEPNLTYDFTLPTKVGSL